jgi:signal transduction histidine kinase
MSLLNNGSHDAFDRPPHTDAIAMISHELRNSLSVVRNAAMLLRVQVGGATVERARTLIERHVAQMNLQVEHLLDSAVLNRRRPPRFARVDLRTILDHCVDSITLDCARRGHHLHVNVPDDALWVNADADRLEQIFLNLLINAAKYTPNGGNITLTLERGAGQAIVSVEDSGIGIAAGQLSRVFEMFVRLESARKAVEDGSGIGLAVVRDLVETHGGTVTASSAGLGRGSEFVVALPALGPP